MHSLAMRRLTCCLLLGMLAPLASATWSIVVVDTHTREVGIASATCLQNFNLKAGLPVLIPGRGAAAAQSLVDVGAFNRMRIWNGFLADEDPNSIFAALAAQDANHQFRQYGIVNVRGQALTFTGTGAGNFAGGLTGRSGSLVYAIQGNVITGLPVLTQAEEALLGTGGDMAERLMAAMEAARAMGGDGRCSCTSGNPASCGSPPPSFNKSADVGFLLVARRGDPPRRCTAGNGCANGLYYLVINVIGGAGDPDPVFTMREQFDAWRERIADLPDAVRSFVSFDRSSLMNDGVSTATMRIELRDWRGMPSGVPVSIVVLHDEDEGSAAVTHIGPAVPIDPDGGVYDVTLTSGQAIGRDVFEIQVIFEDGEDERIVRLMPSPSIRVADLRGDLNADGYVDQLDLLILLAAFGRSAEGDANGDGVTDLADLLILLAGFGG